MDKMVNGKPPTISTLAYIDSDAVVDNVVLGEQAIAWYGCVLRGGINWILVGVRTNLQKGTIIHVAYRETGTTVGEGAVVTADSVVPPRMEIPLAMMVSRVPAQVRSYLRPEELECSIWPWSGATSKLAPATATPAWS
jgi:carbonic anhydrase/acetyltransferase-like protein (isoleucine patch superfamily)